MRCLITGVAGFIGSSLADKLLAEGHEVVGIDCFVDYYPKEIKLRNLVAASENPNFKFIEKNLLDESLAKDVEGIEYIYHQAAQAGVRASWGKTFLSYSDNNVLGTQKLLELASSEQLKKSLKKIVFASSSSIYGDAETLPTLETMRPQPVSPYGVTKLASENLMVLYSKVFKVPTASLRYFTVYGPRQRPDMAFNRFIKAAIKGEEISVYGDGEQSRDFTFISDIVDANISAATSPTKELVFNIGGGSRVTVNQVLAKIENIVGKKINVKYLESQAGDARHTAADTSLAKKELGYQPKVSLDQGLAEEAKWMNQLISDGLV
jgi:nucleoside-diphosphate-sugar epimerase